MSEVHTPLADEADFTLIRYAQCWEDAEIVLEALDVQPGANCFSVASAGDNTLSLLTRNPGRVVAVDLSAAQLACLELRVAAYRHLPYEALLELMGVRPSARRGQLYARLAPRLSADARAVWDAQPGAIAVGIARAGRFERYLAFIRRFAIAPTHTRQTCLALFEPRSREARKAFYDTRWNNRRWRWLLKIACSRTVMGRLGRDPRFFRYAEGSVADHIMEMAEHALVDLDPSDNAYLQQIVSGGFGETLPHALREENFHAIRGNLDRLEWHLADVQSHLDATADRSIDCFNFSDVFEYLSQAESDRVFAAVARTGRPGGRLAYWNMLVPRHRPATLAARIEPQPELSRRLHAAARTFFYTDFVVEAVA